jgi:hypothetical protein
VKTVSGSEGINVEVASIEGREMRAYVKRLGKTIYDRADTMDDDARLGATRKRGKPSARWRGWLRLTWAAWTQRPGIKDLRTKTAIHKAWASRAVHRATGE